MFWLVTGMMAVFVSAILVIPLLRGGNKNTNSSDYDIEVYKNQITELDREQDEGILTDREAEAARTEISRRLLAADNQSQNLERRTKVEYHALNQISQKIAAIGIPIIASGTAFAIYVHLGTPELSGEIYSTSSPKIISSQNNPDIENLDTLAARLANRLKTESGDLEGWLLLGQTYMTLQRHAEAGQSFAQALNLDPINAVTNSAYGEALTFAAGGIVTPAAEVAFQTALKQQPDEIRALFYEGLGRYQRGEHHEALKRWTTLIASSPSNASWLPMVRSRAEDVARELDLDPEVVIPRPSPATIENDLNNKSIGKALNSKEGTSVTENSTKERNSLIEDRIINLTAELKNNPRDFQRWLHLIRTYAMANQRVAAEEALGKALDIFSKAPFPQRQLVLLGQELGLSTTTKGSTKVGNPTIAQVNAANELSAEERAAMIEGMVDSLAARLEDEPKNTEGWLRLARSYEVLKRPTDTRETLARAMKLNPDNIEILTFYARALRSLRNGTSSEDSISVMRKILSLSPNNVEALWFVAHAEASSGNIQLATKLLRQAINQVPTTSPEFSQIKNTIEALEQGQTLNSN